MKKAVYRAKYNTPEEVIKASVEEALELEVVEEPKKEEPKKGRKKKDA